MDRDEQTPEEDVALLRAIPTFAALDDGVLAHLAQAAQRVVLTTGETLFQAGDVADGGYVLLAGRMELSDMRRDGVRRAVMPVEPGALIGEIALIAPTPRPATAVALEPCELLNIARGDFISVLEQHPQAAVKLRRTIAKRLEQTMRALDGVRSELEHARPAPRRP